MRISTRGEYGVRAMFDLAMRFGQGPIPLKTVAERQEISEHYLEQLMGALRKAGLVTSVRGAQGGYELAFAPEDIRIGDILRALEGPIVAVDVTGKEPQAGQIERYAITELWARLTEEINAVLDATTLADLCRKANDLQVQSGTYIYHI